MAEMGRLTDEELAEIQARADAAHLETKIIAVLCVIGWAGMLIVAALCKG